jgi:hypothetical protein
MQTGERDRRDQERQDQQKKEKRDLQEHQERVRQENQKRDRQEQEVRDRQKKEKEERDRQEQQDQVRREQEERVRQENQNRDRREQEARDRQKKEKEERDHQEQQGQIRQKKEERERQEKHERVRQVQEQERRVLQEELERAQLEQEQRDRQELRPPSRPKSPDPLTMRSIGDQHSPLARGSELTGSVLMDWNISRAAYLSATFAEAKDLGDRTSLLILDFQCHPSRGRRFSDMTIEWSFKAMCCDTPTSPPKVVYAAPRHSVGGQTDEQRRKLLGLNAPLQYATLGASIGVEAKAELEVHKVIPYAMTITGTIRGNPADYCVWTVKENGSNATGIPPHFRIAAVLEHDEPFATMLDVEVTIEGERWWRKTFRHRESKPVVDVGMSKGNPEGEPEWWKHVQDLTGEVPNAATIFHNWSGTA